MSEEYPKPVHDILSVEERNKIRFCGEYQGPVHLADYKMLEDNFGNPNAAVLTLCGERITAHFFSVTKFSTEKACAKCQEKRHAA